MNDRLTDITIVLDRSGSMCSVRDDTIGGHNAFLAAQRAEKGGECRVSLVQFDDAVETVYSSRLAIDAPDLTRDTFVPRACTALLDAVGKTIVATGQRLAAMPEADRPGKVLFVIVTDGGENASKEYSGHSGRARVFDMIKMQRDAFKWDFVFLGANQDAIGAGASLGISAGKSMTYASNTAGTAGAFASVSGYTLRTRGAATAEEAVFTNNFTADDRKVQASAGVPQGVAVDVIVKVKK